MGDGNSIVIIIGAPPPQVTDPQGGTEEIPANDDNPRDYQPRENGSNLFNRQWQNSSASDLRAALFAALTGNQIPAPPASGETPDSPYNHQSRQNDETSNRRNQPNVVNQTLDELINTAKGHESFKDFKAQSKEFWDQVRQMSEIRVVDKYVDGSLESKAVSRYGELIERFTRQGGGQMTSFLNTLSPNEREVFQARHLLNQTLGADELFIGKGIVIDKNGQFAVRDFLANNGKRLDVPLNTLVSMLGGKNSENSMASLFTNAQLVLNAKTAALLSLSLALYQNINSTLPLKEAFPEMLAQNLLGKMNETSGMRFVENNLDNSKVNIERRSGETLIAAALINGALVVIDERGKSTAVNINGWTGGETAFGNIFSAGATGAMLGAIIGCVVPLAETNIGTALGFAASVVVGTSERGLRFLSASLLISDVITSGVQTFLSAATTMMLSEKPESQDLLKQQLSNFRTLAYLSS